MLIAAVIVLFTACKKKSVYGNCYACAKYDSIFRGVYILRPIGVVDTECNRDAGWIDFFLKSHVVADTFYVNTDSLSYGYTSWRCKQL